MTRRTSVQTFAGAAAVLKALAHPLRLRLACGLAAEPRSLSRIAGSLDVPLSTLALHLGVLRRAGLLAEEKRGAEVVFHLEDKRARLVLDALCEGCGVAVREWTWGKVGR